MIGVVMQVVVRLYAELRQALGQKEIVVSLPEGATMEELLHRLGQALENKSQKDEVLLQWERGGILVLINGRDSNLTGGLKAALTPDAVVDLIPPLVGG